MGELPLIIFTLFMQAAIGTILFIMVAKLFQKEQDFKLAGLVAGFLSVIGILASLLHLGTPTHALNALSNLGSSWLSREILLSGTFMVLAVIYAILVYVKPTAKTVVNTIGWAAGVVGLVAVFMMAKSYTSTSVPVWQGADAFIEFFATMVILGIVILFVTSFKDLNLKVSKYLALAVFLIVAVQIAFAVPHYIHLGLMGGAGAVSAELLDGMNVLVVVQWLLLILGSGYLLFTRVQEGKMNAAKYYIVGTALCIALIVGRYLFYAISIASRVGLS